MDLFFFLIHSTTLCLLIGTFSLFTFWRSHVDIWQNQYNIEKLKKKDPSICCLQETNENEKKAGLAILVSDKIDYLKKIIIKDKGEHSSEIRIKTRILNLATFIQHSIWRTSHSHWIKKLKN